MASNQQRAGLYGTGGVAVVLADVLSALGVRIMRVFDDSAEILEFAGVPVLPGAVAFQGPLTEPVFVCIGDAAARERVASELDCPLSVAVHPSALVAPSARVGDGSMLFHGAIVQANATVGCHTIVNTAASVDHDCRIGDFVHLAPHSTLCGGVSVGASTEIGAAAVVLPYLSIGSNVKVGAGAVVIHNLPDNVTAVGNPARIVRVDGERI